MGVDLLKKRKRQRQKMDMAPRGVKSHDLSFMCTIWTSL
jgi:hypothetical protein